MKVFVYFCLTSLFLSTNPLQATKTPWQRRIGKGVSERHNLSYQQISSNLWPDEPDVPAAPLDTSKFQTSVSELCGPMPNDRLETISNTISAVSGQFDVDPFLLAALMVHQSGCRPRTPDRESRWGLTRIDVAMHAPQIRKQQYRYYIMADGKWILQSQALENFPFNQWTAQKIESNLYFAAAILSVLSKQCKDLDAAFGGMPHRHFLSHWFYGDKVLGIEPEDAVLTVRRRLISRYLDESRRPAGSFGETTLVSPLDGTPRLMLDYFGNKRGKKGLPGHQGIDLAGLTGEPVRSVADGRISFAGMDMPGTDQSQNATPEEAAAAVRKGLGKGGLWVTVNHRNGFRTCYMHLDSIRVKEGDEIKAGDIIGTLGNTGTVSSGPHLHLEFRTGTGGREDPSKYLGGILVNPWNKDQ